MRKNTSGFTIVELLVVIAVIGILSTISLMSFNRYQVSTRDTQRSSKATILSESLEKYYDNNGEYPGCTSLSDANATNVTTNVLPGIQSTTLLTPKSTSTDTNSIKCQDLAVGGPDIFAYSGDGSADCTGSLACLTFTLKYLEEGTGSVKTITGRHTTVATTAVNVVATTNSSTQITASWNSAPEAVSYNLEYASNSSFTGSTFVNGLAGTSKIVTGLATGQRYYFRVYTVTALLSSQASSSANAVTTLNAPSAPVVATSTPASITTYSWPAITCPAGATVRYQYRYVIDYVGGYTSVWYGPIAGLSSTLDTLDGGYTYQAEVQAQCYNANTVGAWSATGQASFYRAGWSNIAAGTNVACTVALSNSTAWCWGSGVNGALGNNSTADKWVPTAVTATGVLSGKTIASVSVGAYHTCALDTAGKAYCWGYNGDGALGNNSLVNSLVPVAVYTGGVLSGKVLTAISVGEELTCVLDTAGKAYCWGVNGAGQLGRGTTSTYSAVPGAVITTGVLSGKILTDISAGASACAVDSAGKAYCWGAGLIGQLGNNAVLSSSVPVAVYSTGVLSGKTLTAISSGSSYACAVDSAGKAYCWGDGGDGNLGNNAVANSSVPVAVYSTGVLSGKILTAVTASNSGYHTCALDSAGKAYCWGANYAGQLGNNSTTNSQVPVAVYSTGVLSGKTLTAVTAGWGNGCALDSAGKAYCWGEGFIGAIGRNSTVSSLVPVGTWPLP